MQADLILGRLTAAGPTSSRSHPWARALGNPGVPRCTHRNRCNHVVSFTLTVSTPACHSLLVTATNPKARGSNPLGRAKIVRPRRRLACGAFPSAFGLRTGPRTSDECRRPTLAPRSGRPWPTTAGRRCRVTVSDRSADGGPGAKEQRVLRRRERLFFLEAQPLARPLLGPTPCASSSTAGRSCSAMRPRASTSPTFRECFGIPGCARFGLRRDITR